MPPVLGNQQRETAAGTPTGQARLPSVSLPKGGGAIRGIGEKFAANPVTGTGSLTVPILTTSGRSGFSPQLSLSYDSGAGNGPFGLGWSLSLPAITRKTDKGLPTYQESDVFILSGAEDLVPVLVEVDGGWQSDAFFRTVDGVDYTIQRYRPRIEGLFARIERWTNDTTGETHWRSLSRDNVTTLYGRTDESRICDPADPTRVFTWLICETHDDKGNVIVYQYRREDSSGIDLSQVHERNRTADSRSANRYLKRIKYGNQPSRLVEPDLSKMSWLFEVVFDFDEGHHEQLPIDAEGRLFVQAAKDKSRDWSVRKDPFSSYRAGYEVRTYRLCRRVLMFHHFAEELGTDDYLVRSTEFTYDQSAIASFITGVTQSGYVRAADGTYLRKSLPSLELQYSQAIIHEDVQEIDAESLENLPLGLDGARYQWVDLDGEGLSGILTEQADAWFYKPNLSDGKLGPLEVAAAQPSLAALNVGQQQLLDLAGDGQLDLVEFSGAVPGFYERTHDQGWERFTPFASLPNVAWDDPNLKFIDLTGDGHADVLVSEQDVLTWYPSLAETGFGPAEAVRQASDEEEGPRLIFADGTQSIYLADISGDGLTDLVRIRNGEVCYWPNLGYGRFGAKVTMDDAPWFDVVDLFDQRRVRLADIDGSGVTDIIYVGRDGVHIYFNQSGNGWSARRELSQFPQIDNLSAVTAVDLFGNGTACLVWSSPLPSAARRVMRYIDLMGGQKPHLLVQVTNNLGAETRVQYAPSTKFYLADKAADKPWLTRLPFPVHAVERVETADRISRNRFVTRYVYHHGYFDGEEREFRGFGMVEQWDTEELAVLSAGGAFPNATNLDSASHLPPVLTKTWYHTGALLEGDHISRQFEEEYYREGDESLGESGLTDQEQESMLLPDTELPATILLPDGARHEWDLSADEAREACRALKGALLRQEVYGQDGSEGQDRPYATSERSYAVELLQPRASNPHAVFLAHPRETIDFHYERKLYDIGGKKRADPRVSHGMTLEVDAVGNILESVAIGYGRRYDDPDPLLTSEDKDKQKRTLITYAKNSYAKLTVQDDPDVYRGPLLCESRTYELGNVMPSSNQPGITNLFRFGEVKSKVAEASDGDHDLPYEDVSGTGAVGNHAWRRLIEHVRTLYRNDDLTGPLPLGQLHPLALPCESYTLTFTPSLVAQVYGDRVSDAMLADEGKCVHLDGDADWWIATGQVFYSPNAGDTGPQELALARQHFFLPRRFRDPFDHASTVEFDSHDLLISQTDDPLGNTVQAHNDYRILQPSLVTDPNHNRTEVAFDALGMVVGTAVLGKASESKGDSLAGFKADLDEATLLTHMQSPLIDPHAVLQDATMRLLYDLFAYQRTRNDAQPQPAAACTLARETHVADLMPGELTKIQHHFSYSDGFEREIQKKIQAEPGPLVEGGADVGPRWVGSGWSVFNNKGNPVRQYEPFFSATHEFQFAKAVGVSPVLFYDPVERVVATLHPNHTWEKVTFDPWRKETWDVNDTVLIADPKADADAGGFFDRLPELVYLPTWHVQRAGGGLGPQELDAADKAAAHAGTPTVAHFDTLGRTFLTVADNGAAGKYATRVELDIEGNQREVIDAKDRVVMRYDYDMMGNRLHQASMEAGERWTLSDVMGNPIRAWDSGGHAFRTEYDALRRPERAFVQGTAPQDPGKEILFQRTEYGEGQPSSSALNLRTRVFRQWDGAGLVTNEEYDFKGNLLRSSRQLATNYKTTPDWSANPAVEQEVFNSGTAYDALDRPVTLTTPDKSVVRPTYNEASLLERLEVNLRGAVTATAFVNDIDYDAKGQRELIAYGNGVRTTYAFDPVTFRLTHLQTLRGAEHLQDLFYTFDPAGNITAIHDDAQQTIYFNNAVVEPHADYTYDAVYRLISATGREHIGDLSPPQASWNDESRVNLPHPNDGKAMRRYTEQFEYDEVGSFLKLIHQANNGNWTRSYAHNEPSLIEPTKQNNRLSSTTVGTTMESYSHDVHGNMTGMPHVAQMEWDFEDQLQVVDLGGGGKAYYVYDAAGLRTRKVWEKSPSLVEERIYLGGFESFRRRDGTGTITLERETLHVMDDKRRIALVEIKTLDVNAASNTLPAALTRYQHGNHLGSASLELDEGGAMISYEEYYPYGSTSFQAGRNATEVSLKRYRYSSKERDEDTGLYYHGARYYACWLARWTSTDPLGLQDGVNVYSFLGGNPINLVDPTGREGEKGFWAGVEENLYKRGEALVESAPTIWRGTALLTAPGNIPGLVVAVVTHPEGFRGVVKDAKKTVEGVVTAPVTIVKSTGKAFRTLAYGAAHPSKVSPATMGSATTDAILGIADLASFAAPKKPVTKAAPAVEALEEAKSIKTTAKPPPEAPAAKLAPAPESAPAPAKPPASPAGEAAPASAKPDVRPDVATQEIIPLHQVKKKGGQISHKVAPKEGSYRGVTRKMQKRAQELGERYQGPGKYHVGHGVPLSEVPPGAPVRLRSEAAGKNLADAPSIARANELRRQAGLYVRKKK